MLEELWLKLFVMNCEKTCTRASPLHVSLAMAGIVFELGFLSPAGVADAGSWSDHPETTWLSSLACCVLFKHPSTLVTGEQPTMHM